MKPSTQKPSTEQKVFMERLVRVGGYIENKIDIYPSANRYYLRARMWRRWLDENIFGANKDCK